VVIALGLVLFAAKSLAQIADNPQRVAFQISTGSTTGTYFPIGNMLALMSMVIGGVFHRFPKLRVGFMESGCGWLPFWLERLDEHYELMPEQAPGIDRKPSEYVLEGNCFISCEPDEHMLKQVIDLLGDERIVYASDYYHWDCSFPDTVKLIAERNDISDASKKRILSENAKALYPLVGNA